MKNYLYIIILLILIIILNTLFKIENFELVLTNTMYKPIQLDGTVYSSNMLNYYGDVTNLTGLNRSSWEFTLNNPELLNVKSTNKIIVDKADYNRFLEPKGYKLNSKKLKEGYFIAITSGLPGSPTCAFDLMNRTIGVIDRSEELLLDAIIQGYRFPLQNLTRSYVNESDWNNLNSLLDTRFDIIYAFIIPGSKFHAMLSSQQNLNVMGFKNIEINRIKLFQPNISSRNILLSQFYKSTANAISDTKTTQILITQQVIVDLDSKEQFEGYLPLPVDMLDEKYICLGDTTINNKLECESPYDYLGNPKHSLTVWDTPCIKNEDCGYYNANNRGGCIKGQCEFPIGVEQLGFRKYNDIGVNRPFTDDSGNVIFPDN